MTFNFDYTPGKLYCETNGLVWFNDDFLIAADSDAKRFKLTQEQVDRAIQYYFWHMKFLFKLEDANPLDRLRIAFYFLTGWKKK